MVDNAKEASRVTIAVLPISFLLVLSFLLDLQGKAMASILPTVALGAIALHQAYLLRRGAPAQAALDGAPLRRVLFTGLESAIERIHDAMLKYGMSTAVKRKDFMEDVHLLPILSAGLREQCPNNAKVTALAQQAEDLYDSCTRRQE